MTAPTIGLIIQADTVARLAGLPRPLSTDDQWRVEQAILDAQSDVTAYLGQPITPLLATENGLYPQSAYLSLTDRRQWLLSNVPVIEVLTAEPEGLEPFPIGTYTVTYTYGLNVVTDPLMEPVRRWIRASVLASPEVSAVYATSIGSGGRVVTSVSAEGQSISYGAVQVPAAAVAGTAGSGAPGSPPLLSTLDRWRVAGRRVFQRRGYPYYGTSVLEPVTSAPPFLVLGLNDPVPPGTPVGTIIIRH